MPCHQQMSSVLEAQHQISSGKIQHDFLLCVSLLASHLPDDQLWLNWHIINAGIGQILEQKNTTLNSFKV